MGSPETNRCLLTYIDETVKNDPERIGFLKRGGWGSERLVLPPEPVAQLVEQRTFNP